MTRHVPVLLAEVMKELALTSGDTALDGTVGSGGYAKAITTVIGTEGMFVGIDADKTAIETTKSVLADYDGSQCLQVANFRTLADVLQQCGVSGLDGAVFDLGFRSEQLEMNRGFSFQEETPLYMTFKHPDDITEADLTAVDVVNDWSADNLTAIIDGYGNERYAESIATAIVTARKEKRIETTGDLVSIIKQAVPAKYRNGRRHPATRTFQAIRIAVNDEVSALKEGLDAAFSALNNDGRLVVVSFHSIEDRIVKTFFRDRAEEEIGEIMTDSPITAGPDETAINPRSRSAKLRTIAKCPTA